MSCGPRDTLLAFGNALHEKGAREMAAGVRTAAAASVRQPQADLSPGSCPAGLWSQAEAPPFIKGHPHKSLGEQEAMTTWSRIHFNKGL